MSDLTGEDLRLYTRQIALSQLGIEGQRKLRDARVLIVGVGGLGTPLALYLAAAGVGTIGLVDPDTVALDNLHRQILYGFEDVGERKVAVARRELEARSVVEVVAFPERFSKENAKDLISAFDVVCDGTDNFATRYLINDVCVALGKPNVHASIFQFQGQLSVFGLAEGPCYRCLFPVRPAHAPSCAEAGVLGVLPGVMGTLQAVEAIKLILGVGAPLVGRLLLYDALAAAVDEIAFSRDPLCPCCGDGKNPDVLEQAYWEEESCEMNLNVPVISPVELKAELDGPNPPTIVDVREADEREISALPGSIHIPLGEISARFQELDPNADLVIQCRTGGRSGQATAFLIGQGFTRVRNLATGINGWAQTVDPTLPVY